MRGAFCWKQNLCASVIFFFLLHAAFPVGAAQKKTPAPSARPQIEIPSQTQSARKTPTFHPTRVLVKFKQQDNSSAPSIAGNSRADLHAALGGRAVQSFPALGGLDVVELPGGTDIKIAVEWYQQSGLVEYAEPDYVLRKSDTPNDPLLANGSLWGLRNTGQAGGVADADIDAPEGWETQSAAPNVVVAVIDTGVRFTHEDLAANMWTNPDEVPANGIDDDSNGYVDDVYGINVITGTGDPNDDNAHGTHVAGTIGAVGDNGVGGVGVARQVKLMACKFLDANGYGYTSDAIKCIDYTRSEGAHILNNSWGGDAFSQALYDAIKATRNTGIFFVAAAGNAALDNDKFPHYPASYDLDNVVSVAATDRSDVFYDSSNIGLGSVDIVAPGVEITSTWNSSDSSYKTISGTSMAAPHVSGVLALMKAHFPTRSYRQLLNRLYKSTDTLADLNCKCQTGGRVNLAKALTTTSSSPRNNSFANRLNISCPSAQITGSNVDATKESGEPNHAGNAGGHSVWWSWTAPASQSVMITTAGSDFNTLLGIYTGTAAGSLTPVASNDDENAAGGIRTSRLIFEASAGTTYHIAVDGRYAASGQIALKLLAYQLVFPPPNDNFASSIMLGDFPAKTSGSNAGATKETGEPKHGYESGGKSVWWSWTAPSTRRVVVTAERSNFYAALGVYTGTAVDRLTPVRNDGPDYYFSFIATAGTTYHFAVDGGEDWETGEALEGDVRLELFAAPPNDDFADRISLSGLPSSGRGSNEYASNEPGEPFGSQTLWWSWTATSSGGVRVTTEGSNFDTVLFVFAGSTLEGLSLIARNDDVGADGVWSAISFNAVAGKTYQIAVSGYDGEAGNIKLNLNQGPVFSGLTISPSTIAGGCATAIGKVTLTGPARDGGATVNLWTSDSLVVVPWGVLIPAGASSATFPITTNGDVTAAQSIIINAQYDGLQSSKTLKVLPVGVKSLSLTPNPATGPATVTGTVTLDCSATPDGITVHLTSSKSSLARITDAEGASINSITIPAGTSTGTFYVRAADAGTPGKATITARANNISKSVTLNVN